MAVSPEEALAAQEAQKAAEAKAPIDRGDDFTPTEDDDEDIEARSKPDDDGVADEPEVKPAAAETDEADEADEDDGDDQRKPVLIPKHRYDSQAAKTRAAEAEAQRLKTELAKLQQSKSDAPAATTDFDAQLDELETKYAQHILDGDAAKAKTVRAEIRKLERELYTADAGTKAETLTRQELERRDLMQTIEVLENEYPVFDKESTDFDENLVNEVLDLHEAFLSSGKYSPSDAMLRAVGYVMKGADPTIDEPKKTEKRKTDLKKNVETSKKQPPDLADAGSDSNKAGKKGDDVDVSRLSMEEFDALPETTKKRLRGDFV